MLTGWYLERKQQLDASLANTVRNGDMVNGKNWTQIFLRSWGLWFMQFVPSWKHWLERGPRGTRPTRYIHAPEMPFLPELGGGVSFPQTYCISLGDGAEVQFTDDVIFHGKRGIFQIVVLLNTLDEMDAAVQEIEDIKAHEYLLSAAEATFFVPRVACESAPAGRLDAAKARPLFRTASSTEFSHSTLCNSRPEPRGYNESLIWDTMGGARYVVLRLDRFVFATCNSKAELEQAFGQLSNLI